MMYVAIAACAAAAVTAVVLGNLLRIVVRQAARERDLLVNQVCNLAGRPWREPPAAAAEPSVSEPDELELVASPEQLPDW